MNDKRRSVLKRALDLLRQASELVSSVKEDEEDALYNMPDNLQSSERYEKMEDAISALEETEESIESAIEKIETASE